VSGGQTGRGYAFGGRFASSSIGQAPEGRNAIAQGAALGSRVDQSVKPRRGAIASLPQVSLIFRPSGAWVHWCLEPRAAPWAIALRPSGATGRSPRPSVKACLPSLEVPD